MHDAEALQRGDRLGQAAASSQAPRHLPAVRCGAPRRYDARHSRTPHPYPRRGPRTTAPGCPCRALGVRRQVALSSRGRRHWPADGSISPLLVSRSAAELHSLPSTAVDVHPPARRCGSWRLVAEQKTGDTDEDDGDSDDLRVEPDLGWAFRRRKQFSAGENPRREAAERTTWQRGRWSRHRGNRHGRNPTASRHPLARSGTP